MSCSQTCAGSHITARLTEWGIVLSETTIPIGQVTIEDALVADETFDMLMGNVVAPRKKFIQTHAREVQNLDV